MRTFTVYNDPSAYPDRDDIDQIVIGKAIYPIRTEHIHTGGTQIYFRTTPGLTNLSHEPRERGWLGTTNDVEAVAMGRFTVVEIKRRRLRDGRERVDVKVK